MLAVLSFTRNKTGVKTWKKTELKFGESMKTGLVLKVLKLSMDIFEFFMFCPLFLGEV